MILYNLYGSGAAGYFVTQVLFLAPLSMWTEAPAAAKTSDTAAPESTSQHIFTGY